VIALRVFRAAARALSRLSILGASAAAGWRSRLLLMSPRERLVDHLGEFIGENLM
jgi:hypothetical protein